MTNSNARPEHEDDKKLAKLKKAGVVEGGRSKCSLCRDDAGDCRPAPIAVMTWVPAMCNECYRWIKDRDLFDEQRDKQLFYPDEVAADGGRPKHEV